MNIPAAIAGSAIAASRSRRRRAGWLPWERFWVERCENPETTKKTALRLCTDCKWCHGVGEFSRCGHPDVVSAVDGVPREFCSTQRKFWWLCGRKGKLWEPKE